MEGTPWVLELWTSLPLGTSGGYLFWSPEGYELGFVWKVLGGVTWSVHDVPF